MVDGAVKMMVRISGSVMASDLQTWEGDRNMPENNDARLACYLVLVFVMALFTCGGAAAETKVHEMKRGISFSYPSEWTAREGREGSLLILRDPQNKDAQISVAVIEGVVPNSLPPDETEWLRRVRVKDQKIELTSFKKDVVAGKDAIRVEFVMDLKGIPMYSRRVNLQNGDCDISISFTYRDKDKPGAAGDVFEAVVNSLAFE
jgi:hypothetical protein